jgi:acetoin utilization deacetylase AcuC-like enzyme
MKNDFLIYFSDEITEHRPFPGLLELPRRSHAIKSSLQREFPFVEVTRKSLKEDLYAVHDKEYVNLIFAMSKMGMIKSSLYSLFDKRLQYYCRVSPGTANAITSSCGLLLQAFDDIIAKRIAKAFCIVRPPGHHAGIARGEGFCLVNNIAVIAKKALDVGMRVAIVDFDRHHGNGTQEIVKTFDEKVLLISSYQEGCKYAKGYEEGLCDNSLLLSLPAHSSDDVLVERYITIVAPALIRHAPDIVLISAGFDMCDGDPLTNLHITLWGYWEITRILTEIANKTARGRIISVLEGGYEPSLFMPSLHMHVKALYES